LSGIPKVRTATKRAFVATGTVLALAISSAVAGSATSAYAKPDLATATASVPAQDNLAALIAASHQVDKVGAQDPNYAGAKIDAGQNSVTVFRVDPTSTAPTDSTLRSGFRSAVAADIRLEYAQALLTLTQVGKLNSLMEAEREAFMAAGTIPSAWGQMGFDQPFTVYYTGARPSSKLTDPFYLYAPKDTVIFSTGRATAVDRNSDTSPFFGGAAIHGTLGGANNSTIAQCTSNFAMKSTANSQYYIPTAWHCLNANDPRYWATNSPSGGTFMGSVTTSTASTDSAFINLSGSGHAGRATIWSGSFSNPSQIKPVVGAQNPVIGQALCTSGMTSGAVCNETVINPFTWQVQNQYSGAFSGSISGYVVAQNSNSEMIADGDSGGIVFSLASGNTEAIAVGLISAGFVPGTVPCPSYIPGAFITCFKQGLIVGINSVMSGHSLTAFGFS